MRKARIKARKCDTKLDFEEVKEEAVKLIQPTSSYAEYSGTLNDNDVGKDFEHLVNASISEGGHFVFKSEKSWSVDVSHFSEIFTLDLKTLSAAINCIPFNKCIDIPDKYFTVDQLTDINNTAEKAKKIYKAHSNDVNESTSSNILQLLQETSTKTVNKTDKSEILVKHLESEKLCDNDFSSVSNKSDSTDDIEKELDSLLFLKEPIRSIPTQITPPMPLPSIDNSTVQMKTTSTKPIDLEKWLDSVLED